MNQNHKQNGQSPFNQHYPYSYLYPSPNEPNSQLQQPHAYDQYNNYNNWYQQQQQQPNYYQNYNYAQHQPHQYPQQNYQQQNYNQYRAPSFQNQQKYNQNTYNYNQNGNFKNAQYRNRNPNQNFNSNSNNANTSQPYKKQKIDKRDLPENNKYFCEACDRGFKLEEKYNEHLSTHRICGVDGCKFEAADKLVQIHNRNFHATGLDKKIPSFESAEEIKKYIDERKKNFPSKNNIENKVDEENEKIDRREILKTKEFRKDNRGISKNNRKRKGSKFNRQKYNQTTNPNTNTNDNLQEENIKKDSNSFKKPTLLEQLLAPEIRHERNILLQCIKYIAEKNYYVA